MPQTSQRPLLSHQASHKDHISIKPIFSVPIHLLSVFNVWGIKSQYLQSFLFYWIIWFYVKLVNTTSSENVASYRKLTGLKPDTVFWIMADSRNVRLIQKRSR